MSDATICGGLCITCCYSGLFSWCGEKRNTSNQAGKQSGCFPRGCGGIDDEDGFDRTEREERERRARLAVNASRAGAAPQTVAQPGKVEPMLAIVNPEYLAEVEAGKIGGVAPRA